MKFHLQLAQLFYLNCGVGILYDSFNQRRLFFTKDGKMLGESSWTANMKLTIFAEYFPAVIHKGMDVFPGISFEKTARIEFTANFTGPFKLDPRTILNYRADTADRLSKIPSEILAQCLYYVSNDPSELLLPRLVSAARIWFLEKNSRWSLAVDRCPKSLRKKAWTIPYGSHSSCADGRCSTTNWISSRGTRCTSAAIQ